MKYKHKKTGLEVEKGEIYTHYITIGSKPINGVYPPIAFPKELIEDSNDWEQVIEIPRYVKCIKIWSSDQLPKSIINHIYCTNVKPTFSIFDWDKIYNSYMFTEYFIPATKEEFDEQERDYEILSFRRTSGNALNCIKTKNAVGLFTWIYTDTEETEKSLLQKDGFVIHSVKRKSDGEVFTVGDIYKSTLPNIKFERTINSFDIKNGKCLINVSASSLKHIIKVKQPLFTTEDGVDIFEGDNYFELALTFKPSFREAIYEEIGKPNIFYDYNIPEKRKKLNDNGRYYFSTKEKAEEYILMNKPCLSIKEIAPIIGMVNNSQFIDLDILTYKLKQLVKSKI